MNAAAVAEKAGRWADAVAQYTAALKAVPNEPRASAGLRNATFQLYVSTGKALHAAKRFAEAVKQYEAALKLAPTSAEVKDLLARAKAGRP
jgi:tetratricopeptide (TPR) repeat protein